MGHYRGRDNRKRRAARRRRNDRAVNSPWKWLDMPRAFDAIASAMRRAAEIIERWFQAVAAKLAELDEQRYAILAGETTVNDCRAANGLQPIVAYDPPGAYR